jgi:hypothetical protein
MIVIITFFNTLLTFTNYLYKSLHILLNIIKINNIGIEVLFYKISGTKNVQAVT